MNWQISYVEPIIFTYMFCLMLTYPVEVPLMYQKVCLSHFNQKYCNKIDLPSNDTKKIYNENLIHSETAEWQVYTTIAKTLPSLFSTIVFGAWSDGTGRKKLLMLPIFGELMNSICFLLNAWYISAPVYYLLIGNFVSGLFGSFGTILMGVHAYVSDKTDVRSRTKRLTILDSMTSLGSCASYLLGGVILDKFGFVAVYGLLICLYVGLIIYLCFLKESYHPVEKLSMMDLFFKGKIVAILKLFSSRRKVSSGATLFLLCSSLFYFLFIWLGIDSTVLLYLKHQPFNFSPSKIGYFLAECNGIRFIGSTVINLILIQKYKWSDYSIVLITSVIYGAIPISLALSNKEWHVFLAPLWCLGIGAGVGAVQGSISKMFSTMDQGKIFSALACVEVTAPLLSTSFFETVYKDTLDIDKSFVFYLMASLCFFPLFFSILLIYELKNKDHEIDKEIIDSGNMSDSCLLLTSVE